MKWFYNLKVAAKLLIGFIIVALISGVVGFLGITNINKIDGLDQDMYNRQTSTMDELATVMQDYQIERVTLRDVIMQKDNNLRDKSINQFKELDKTIDDSMVVFKAGIQHESTLQVFNDLSKSINEYRQYRDKIVNLVKTNQENEAISSLYTDGTVINQDVQNEVSKLLKIKVDNAKGSADTNKATAKSAETIMIIVVAIAMLLAIILGVFISRIISKPINNMVRAAEKIAEGDLNINIDINTKDEIGTLATAYQKMIAAIKGLIADTNLLTKAALEGELGTRADSAKHGGEYKKLVDGINNTLDAIVNPLNEAIDVMDKMAVNDFTTRMGDGHKGMLKEFADSINDVQEHILALQNVAVAVSMGDISGLDAIKKVGKRSENDRLRPAFIEMMENIQELINEVENVADASVNGNLSIRGNSSKFKGGYKEIIDGFNNTMDAVVKPIQEASDVLQQMAEGNLTVSMAGNYNGDYAKIKNDLNATIKAFNNVLKDINDAAQQVASGANQISDSAQSLSQGSTEQASSIEELTASIEEIAAQTTQNAANANQASELALTAKENAVRGNEQMNGMLKAMDEINDASGNISKIIKVIDEIAFQTNILALNAAVEAARAGQHGKGFAVVAEEVRNLAARSANAAKETTVLIEGSIKKVEGGTKIANVTAGALNEIVETVSKAAALVGEIAIASNEQASGIAQINQGITQVSQVVQTNSATSEESAAASEELSSQAEVLKNLVEKFKLKKGDSSINQLEELNPDVLKMLESMAERKRMKNSGYEQARAEAAVTKTKIALSDNEFGKY